MEFSYKYTSWTHTQVMPRLEGEENMQMKKSQALITCFIPPAKDKAIILIAYC